MLSPIQLHEKSRRWQQAQAQLIPLSHPVVMLPQHQQLLPIDLSAANPILSQLDVVDTKATADYINHEIGKKGAAGAIGGYLENRLLYLRSAVFAGTEHRTLHLGIDIWMPAGTPIYNLLPGRLHSFADNASFGDYGPTLILEHQLAGLNFYSLYGHLSRASLQNLQHGARFDAGVQLGSLGNEGENGNWPPHLHLQLMLDMQGKQGDFPGVAPPSQRDYYAMLCPDPGPLLGL